MTLNLKKEKKKRYKKSHSKERQNTIKNDIYDEKPEWINVLDHCFPFAFLAS